MINRLLKFVMLIIVALMIFTITSEAFTMQPSLNKQNVKVGEEVIYTIKLDEKVVATNFEINYDSNTFELVGSNTTGLNVAEKNGKIACIYADISGVGTDTFQIKLKAKAKTNDASFSLEGAKFRAVNATTSYTGSQITGLETTVTTTVEKPQDTNTENNNVVNDIVNDTVDNSQSENKVHTNTIVKPGTNTTDKTTSGESELPQTGESDMIIKLLVLSALLIIVNKIRVDRFKDI